jgi:hypothetical protein
MISKRSANAMTAKVAAVVFALIEIAIFGAASHIWMNI